MADSRRLPVFQLYGSPNEWPLTEMMHCETIAARSRLNNWHIRPHRHAQLYQILYLQAGEAWCLLEDERHHLRSPVVVEVPPSCGHGYEFRPACRGYVISVTTVLLDRLLARFNEPQTPPHTPLRHHFERGTAIDRELQQACTHLNALYQSTQAMREVCLEAWLTLLYARLRETQPSTAHGRHGPPGRSQQHYQRFDQLLEDAYTEHHTVAWYADRLGMTAAHLNVITRTQAGRTPLQLIHARLALEASRRLIYTSQTVSEIADTLGFSEPAHFTRFFRRMAGESPRRFRRRSTEPVG